MLDISVQKKMISCPVSMLLYLPFETSRNPLCNLQNLFTPRCKETIQVHTGYHTEDTEVMSFGIILSNLKSPHMIHASDVYVRLNTLKYNCF